MRILYCNKYNFEFSGTEVYLSDVMRMMQQQGHEVALFSMASRHPQQFSESKLEAPFVDFKDESQSLLKRMQLAAHAIYSTGARGNLRKLLQDFRPGVAHVRNIYHHLSPSILWELRAAKVPVIYHVNDFKMFCPTYNFVAHGKACERCRDGNYSQVVKTRCYSGGFVASTVLAMEGYVHHWLRTYEKCVDVFLAPSVFVRDKLIANGISAGRISVLPHFQRIADRGNTENIWDSVLYFGRLSPEKGIADLIEAARHLPHISFRIAGDGPERRRLEEQVAMSGMENVLFLGHLSGTHLQEEIASSRFTVLPSRAYETFGKTILESYACARAVIATDLGSRRELIADQSTGLLYRTGNAEELAQKISWLWSRPERALEMGRNGLTLAKERYAPEHHYEHLLNLYSGLVKSPAAMIKAARPLRVAFIGGRGVVSRYSGIESCYEEVGSRLCELGHEVTVYCRNYFTPAIDEYRGVKIVRLPTMRSKHFETVLHTFLSTIHACWQRYDIVHYQALGPALFSWIPRLFGMKTIVTVQGLDWQRKKWGRVASTVLRIGEKASVTFPNRTMVVSKTLVRYFRDKHSTETSFVPNGTTLREVRRGLNLVRWELKPDGYALFLGRFSPEKNCHLLVQAFERIQTPYKLVLAGGSSYTDEYACELRNHASDRIIFLNWVSGEALDELLTNAAVFVLPSDLEGLSLALLDAMGAGVCPLTSDIPENRELVDGAGFTFRAGDAQDLERVLRVLLSHPEIRQEAGKAARQRVKAAYLWPDIAKQVARIYFEVAGGKVDSLPPKKSHHPEHFAESKREAA